MKPEHLIAFSGGNFASGKYDPPRGLRHLVAASSYSVEKDGAREHLQGVGVRLFLNPRRPR